MPDIRVSLDAIALEKNQKMQASFLVSSTDEISISQDPDNPTVITGFANMDGIFGFELNATDGSMKNMMTRDIGGIAGSLTMQFDKPNSNVITVNVWSQRSTDGITWVDLDGGLRSEEVSGTNESFSTKASFTGSWPDTEWIRFVCSATGTINIKKASLTKTSGTITGQSVVWWLKEL